MNASDANIKDVKNEIAYTKYLYLYNPPLLL